MKTLIERIPVVGPAAGKAYSKIFRIRKPFPGSEKYWIQRYKNERTSGTGSYDHLSKFKAEILNDLVKELKIESIIEYGCGDGNQLGLAEYPKYLGFDVSPDAIKRCRESFQNDESKSFKIVSDYKDETAQATFSLDVIYHLVEEDVFTSYMSRLFESAQQYVVIYSTDFDTEPQYHGRHWKFTNWVEANQPNWKLIRHIPNRYQVDEYADQGSHADFYLYEKSCK